MTLEYRVSRQFQSIGELDGNARWQTVPVGQADFERSIERLPAVKLISFSATEEGLDRVSKAVIGFSRLEDVLPLLDAGGEGARLIREGNQQILQLRLGRGGGEQIDPQLLALAEQVMQGYALAVSLSAPAGVELRFPGSSGEGLQLERTGKKAGFSTPIFPLVSRREALTAEFVF
jgi:hypothetical protein